MFWRNIIFKQVRNYFFLLTDLRLLHLNLFIFHFIYLNFFIENLDFVGPHIFRLYRIVIENWAWFWKLFVWTYFVWFVHKKRQNRLLWHLIFLLFLLMADWMMHYLLLIFMNVFNYDLTAGHFLAATSVNFYILILTQEYFVYWILFLCFSSLFFFYLFNRSIFMQKWLLVWFLDLFHRMHRDLFEWLKRLLIIFIESVAAWSALNLEVTHLILSLL